MPPGEELSSVDLTLTMAPNTMQMPMAAIVGDELRDVVQNRSTHLTIDNTAPELISRPK